ncbi:hypothetical protein TNCV_2169261 [Trichonephila clavipes]|nr:hypothetical protein TNCV_2169261 [Trichonephila clavipes]
MFRRYYDNPIAKLRPKPFAGEKFKPNLMFVDLPMIVYGYGCSRNFIRWSPFVQGRRSRIIRLAETRRDHKLSPIFKGPFVIVRPVGAVCYEIKSRTLQIQVYQSCPCAIRSYRP